MARDSRVVDDPLDFGLYYPRAYAIATWLRLKDWGEYPNGKPYDAQPARLLQDYAALDERYGDIYEKLKADNDWQPETFELFVMPEPVAVSVPGAPAVPGAEPVEEDLSTSQQRGRGFMARIRR